MIEIENVTHKFSRIYRTVDDINNFMIRIRLGEELSKNEDVVTFKWQEKRFSPQQKEHYKEAHNCITDIAKEYHQQVIKETRRGSPTSSIIFSYVARDNFAPEISNSSKYKGKHEAKLDSELAAIMENCHIDNIELEQCEETANVNKTKINEEDKLNYKVYDYFESLQESSENIITHKKQIFNFEVMYIMADFGEFYQSTWLKREHILCIVKYDHRKKILIMTPDFTMFDAHILKVTSEETKIMRYWIENASLDGVTNQELRKEVNLLNQIQSTKKSKALPQFERKADGSTMHVYIFMEILSGWDFEYPNVFVRYYVQLNNWKVINNDDGSSTGNTCLTGVTMACARENTNGKLHFGLPIDFTLASAYKSTEDPVVYFELISKDTWSRYRCEGLARMSLPIRLPGRRTERLTCYRITSGVVNELRRFFIGDCANYKSLFDPASSSISQNGVMNRLATSTISTGCLEIRTSIMHFGAGSEDAGCKGWENLREMRLRDKLRDPQLTHTVEEAVGAFKRARAAMLEARLAV